MKLTIIASLILTLTACSTPSDGDRFNLPAFYTAFAVSIGLMILSGTPEPLTVFSKTAFYNDLKNYINIALIMGLVLGCTKEPYTSADTVEASAEIKAQSASGAFTLGGVSAYCWLSFY